MSQKSLGLIETTGLTAAIEAADAAVKSANVELVGYELAKGGGMTVVKLYGEVGAVNAAIAAASAAAAKINTVVSTKVIARPADGIKSMVITKDTVGVDLPKPPEPPEPTPPSGGGDGPKSGPDETGDGGSESGAEVTGEENGASAPAPEQAKEDAKPAENASADNKSADKKAEATPAEAEKPEASKADTKKVEVVKAEAEKEEAEKAKVSEAKASGAKASGADVSKTEELDLKPVAEVKSIEAAKPASTTGKSATTRKTGRGRRRRA
nr:BMC domain-containing protein [uncultured Cohaesibacter sp.]